jgi:hypothetical protein
MACRTDKLPLSAYREETYVHNSFRMFYWSFFLERSASVVPGRA